MLHRAPWVVWVDWNHGGPICERVFTPEEGATEHIGLDHLPYMSTYVADWVNDTFAGPDSTKVAAVESATVAG